MKCTLTPNIAGWAMFLLMLLSAGAASATCPPNVTRLELINPSQGPNIGNQPHGIWADHMFCGTDYTYFYILPGTYLDIYEDGTGAELNGSAKLVHGDNCRSSQGDTFDFHITFYDPSDSGLTIRGKDNLPGGIPDTSVKNGWLYFVAHDNGYFAHGTDTIRINHFFGMDPNTAKYGLQIGQNATGKNISYGMAWWFSYVNGERTGVGDFSVELDTVCTPECPPSNTRYQLVNPSQGPNIGLQPHGMWADHIFCGTDFTYFYMLPGTYLDLSADGKTAHLWGKAKLIVGGQCGYNGRIYNFDINLISDDSAGLTITGKDNLPAGLPDSSVMDDWIYYVAEPGGYMAHGTDTIHFVHYFGTNPSVVKYGMQIGQNANGKNISFGMAWWNTYSYQNGTRTGVGDFSVELDSICSSPGLQVSVCPDQDVVKGYDPENYARIEATVTGGVPPYTYSWTNTDQTNNVITVKPSSTTEYTLTVTDAANNTAMTSHTVTVHDIRTGYNNDQVKMCKYGNTYCVDKEDVEKKLGWGYELGPCNKNYDLDGGTCGEPDFPIVSVCPDQDAVKGYDPENWVRIEATVSGGTAPYSFSWTNTSQTGPVINVKPSSTTYYTVTVTDANGLTATAIHKVKVYDIRMGYGKVVMCKYGNSYCIDEEDVEQKLDWGYKLGYCSWNIDLEGECGEPNILRASVCPDQDVVKGYDPENWARIEASATGGTPPYTFTWTNTSDTGAVINVKPSYTTTYTVTVTDANNETATASHKVTVFDIRTGYHNDQVKMCKYGNTYCVDVEDVPEKLGHGYSLGYCNCNINLNTACGQPNFPVVTVCPDQDVVKGYDPENWARIEASATGGTPPYTFTWTNTSDTGAVINVKPSYTTTYTVTVKDANNVTATASHKVTVYDIRTGYNNDQVKMCKWGNTYCVDVEDVPEKLSYGYSLGYCNCNINLNTSCGQPNFPTVSVCDDQDVVYGYDPENWAKIVATASGGVPPYTYSWTNSDSTGPVIVVKPSSTTYYTVTVTDAENMTAIATHKVKVYDVRTGYNNDKVKMCKNGCTYSIDPEDVPTKLNYGYKFGSCSWNIDLETECGQPDIPEEPQGCACEDGLKEIKVKYHGPSNSCVLIYTTTNSCWWPTHIKTFYDVDNGDELTIKASYGNLNMLGNYTYLKIYGECYSTVIPTNCEEEDLIGSEYGSYWIGEYKVLYYKDKNYNTCEDPQWSPMMVKTPPSNELLTGTVAGLEQADGNLAADPDKISDIDKRPDVINFDTFFDDQYQAMNGNPERLANGDFKYNFDNISGGKSKPEIKAGKPQAVVSDVYPNPFRDKIFVEALPNKDEQVNIKIVDALGKVIFVDAVVGNGNIITREIKVPGEKGVYFVEVESATTGKQVFKVVKQ